MGALRMIRCSASSKELRDVLVYALPLRRMSVSLTRGPPSPDPPREHPRGGFGAAAAILLTSAEAAKHIGDVRGRGGRYARRTRGPERRLTMSSARAAMSLIGRSKDIGDFVCARGHGESLSRAGY